MNRSLQLNIYCDLLTKVRLRKVHKENTTNKDTLPHETIIIRINGTKVTGEICPPLRDEASTVSIRDFYTSKGILPIHAFDKVDWDAIKHNMINTKQHHRI